jgi:guanine deaminase
MANTMPERPPFVLRARLVTPLATGGLRDEPDAVLVVDDNGRIAWLGPWAEWRARGGHVGPGAIRPGGPATAGDGLPPVVDLRPWLVMPGLVDLHAHLPQIPNAGIGAGLDLLTWLERCIFPLERAYDGETAERLAPATFRAFAAAGTTTVLAYAAIYEESTDVVFRAAEAHGIRAVIGQVLMDRLTYDPVERHPDEVRERALAQSASLCRSWDGRDSGRLRYAFTPRFGVSCTAELLRESAALARETGAYWQTHVAEDRHELMEVRRLFPEAIDYLDVYDRASGLGERTILAHAIHLSDREVARIAETGTRIAHCPASNLFLGSGLMPLAAYMKEGISIGLGSDVAAGPELSMFAQMRAGADTQVARRATGADSPDRPTLTPADWLRMATLGGARALGIDDVTGSLEPGKEADFIAVDSRLTEPLPGSGVEDLDSILSRLVYRTHPGMIRGAWVRGRCLAGPPGAQTDSGTRGPTAASPTTGHP